MEDYAQLGRSAFLCIFPKHYSYSELADLETALNAAAPIPVAASTHDSLKYVDSLDSLACTASAPLTPGTTRCSQPHGVGGEGFHPCHALLVQLATESPVHSLGAIPGSAGRAVTDGWLRCNVLRNR